MRTPRAKISAVRRRRKNGTVTWAARGYVPERTEDGRIIRRRVEYSLEGLSAAARQAEVDRLNAVYEARVDQRPITFARAYTNYVESGHPVPLYYEAILRHLAARPCHEINDSVMLDAARAMFKPDAKPSYINRHLYTPVLAVLRMALRERAPHLTRPAGHKAITPITIPDATWFQKLRPHLGPDTLALVAFLTTHGRRLGDALGRTPADFDPEAGTLLIGKTKTGEPMLIDLHPGVRDLIDTMPGWASRRWLFRDGPNSASNVRKDIQKACASAGLEYFSPHELGRHAFATRLLRAGYSLQHVKEAGGWKTIEMPAERYGHLGKSEVTAAIHKVADGIMPATGANWGASQSLPDQTIDNEDEKWDAV